MGIKSLSSIPMFNQVAAAGLRFASPLRLHDVCEQSVLKE
jgi:hypothetical protein